MEMLVATLKFMSNSPFLTFFILLIFCITISEVVKYICNAGRCPDCKVKHEKEMNDE